MPDSQGKDLGTIGGHACASSEFKPRPGGATRSEEGRKACKSMERLSIGQVMGLLPAWSDTLVSCLAATYFWISTDELSLEGLPKMGGSVTSSGSPQFLPPFNFPRVL